MFTYDDIEGSIFEKNSIFNKPQNKRNVDCVINNYGKSLLDVCKSKNLFILNGRLGPDY